MNRTLMSLSVVCLSWGLSERCAVASESSQGIPVDAKYACPMETHPDEADPSAQGAHFSDKLGVCPRCGMQLKPLEELPWARLRQSAHGGDVAYTCPEHQHVFSKTAGECPRCGHRLMPFKVMYTCPDPKHAEVISEHAENCPLCGRGLAAFRGIWLDASMADRNLPPFPGLAEAAAFRCPLHPLVHSDKPGSCTICGHALERVRPDAETAAAPIAPNAKYVCPMHPDKVESNEPGTCSICGMQLVHAATFSWPKEAPQRVAAQVNYITEHYLELQSLLASDRAVGIARQALALVSASEELLRHIGGVGGDESQRLRTATERLRAAALKITGENMEQDRATFVELSASFEAVIEVARPSPERWSKLYIYHCPMSKGDWVQSDPAKRNPYYGFKMLTCGELKDVK